MDLEGFLGHLSDGKTVDGGSEMHQFMHGVSQEAIRICVEMNSMYHTPEELAALFAELTGRPTPEASRCSRHDHRGRCAREAHQEDR